MSLNFVGAWIGKSPTFSPFKNSINVDGRAAHLLNLVNSI